MGASFRYTSHPDTRLPREEENHVEYRTSNYVENGARLRSLDFDTESGSIRTRAEYNARR